MKRSQQRSDTKEISLSQNFCKKINLVTEPITNVISKILFILVFEAEEKQIVPN